jgi:microcystin-dependent protein
LGSVIVPSGGILNLQDGVTSNICPIGCIMMMAQQTTLTGWLVCNGTSLSTTGTYASLFAIIGYTYGGSGSLFKVPDFRGAFLRGFSSPGTARNLSYASGAFGQYQESQIGSHAHSISTSNNGVNTNIGTAYVPTSVTNLTIDTQTETRPYNYCVEYYIKY